MKTETGPARRQGEKPESHTFPIPRMSMPLSPPGRSLRGCGSALKLLQSVRGSGECVARCAAGRTMESGTLKGHIAMGAAAIIWGLMSPVSKLVMQPGEVSSASLATFRLLGAAILFWLASAFVPGETIARKDRLTLFYASLFGIIFNQMAFTVGVGFTSPADAAIITTITPVLTMILAAFVLREMITGKKSSGSAPAPSEPFCWFPAAEGVRRPCRETTTCWGTSFAWPPSAA